MKLFPIFGALVLLLGLAMMARSADGTAMKTISDFNGGNGEPEWFSVDDSVMGGISKGKTEVKGGTMMFSGDLSLKNDGGFSSIRTAGKYDFSGKSGFVLRVKGDGRTYKMRIETDARHNGSEIGYQVDFSTEEGKYIEVKVPFTSFEPGWRGEELNGPPLDLSKVEEIGIVLADGKEGPFALEVDWLGVR